MRNRRTMKIVLVTLSAVLAAAGTAGVLVALADRPAAPRAAPSPEPLPTDRLFGMRQGATVTLDDDDSRVQVTVRSVTGHRSGCGSSAPEPGRGMYVVVDVAVTVVAGTADVDPRYFGWVAADGTVSDAVAGSSSGCERSSLSSSTGVRAGQIRTGEITFDVPSARGQVQFTPGLFSEAVASWRVG